MAKRSITAADVAAVLASPTKQLPADDGCVNLWGFGPSKKRIRVTVNPARRLIVTVANADSRIES
jgi:hypothetical protein